MKKLTDRQIKIISTFEKLREKENFCKVTLQDVSDKIGITRASVLQQIERMIKKGYAQRIKTKSGLFRYYYFDKKGGLKND